MQAESDAPHRVDIVLFRAASQLGADIANVDIDRLVLAHVELVPSQLIQIPLAEDACRMLNEQLQNGKFPPRQLQGMTIYGGDVGFRIDG